MMKITYAFFIALFLSIQSSSGQPITLVLIDSLKRELAKNDDENEKVALLVKLMNAHIYIDPRKGLSYAKAAMELAEKTHSTYGIAQIKDKIGRLNWRMGNFTEALNNHFKAYGSFNAFNDHYKYYILIEIGQDYLDGGNYADAEYYLLRALKLSTAVGEKKMMANAYDIIVHLYNIQGNISAATKHMAGYLKVTEELGNKQQLIGAVSALQHTFEILGNSPEMIKYFNIGLETAKEARNDLSTTQFYLNIMSFYINEGNISAAESYRDSAVRLAATLSDAQLTATVSTQLGLLQMAKQNYRAAIGYYLDAVNGFKSADNKERLANSYSNLGKAYTKAGDYKQARLCFDSLKKLYDHLNGPLISRMGYYEGLEKLDSATGDWHNAYLHHKEYIRLKNNTLSQESIKQIVGSQFQYETEKKDALSKAAQEKKDVEVKEELRRQRNIRNSAFAVLALVLAFSVVVIRQRNKIANEKKRSDKLVTDKELLLREIHHRVKNNLEIVSSLLALQSAQIDDAHTKEAMLEGQNRVQSIGIVHQKLYQGDNLGAVEMKDYFINLSESILDSFGAEGRINVELAMDKLDVDIDTAVPLGLIVNELLTNTLKYAFPGNQKGSVRIKLEKQTDGLLHLEVSDNGVGKSGETKGTGFGGQLISLLTRQLNGSMTEEIKNGTHISFDFKSEKAA